jgi:hypothetical protein
MVFPTFMSFCLPSPPVLNTDARFVFRSFPKRLNQLELVVVRELTDVLSRLLDPHLGRVVPDDEIRIESVRVVLARQLRIFLSVIIERHHADLREMHRHIRRHALGVLDAEPHHLGTAVEAIQQLPAFVLVVKILESALLLLDPVSIFPRKRGLSPVNHLGSLGSHYWFQLSDFYNIIKKHNQFYRIQHKLGMTTSDLPTLPKNLYLPTFCSDQRTIRARAF